VTLTIAANNATAYQWRKDGVDVSEGSNYNTATYTTAALTATATYSVVVTNGMDACSTTSDNAVVTVHKLPTITLASGSTAQTVTYGTAMTQIKYNTANASSATVAGLPSGVSGAWASNVYTISGTATGSGTHNYTVTTTNGNGCTNAKATGRITVSLPATCDPTALTLGTVGFANNTTYERNGITLSAPVTVTYCSSATYGDGSTTPPYPAKCQSNSSYTADWFSWCMVTEYGSKLCPSPWRVPSYDDFCKYGGQSADCNVNVTDRYAGVDGWELTGYCQMRWGPYNVGSIGMYWTKDELSDQPQIGKSVQVYSDYIDFTTASGKYHGLSLRCVK
jgi:hypothetical protein